MDLDFTHAKYNELCTAINYSKYNPMTVKDYLSEGGDAVIILRHDVDREPEKALRMAQIENEYGIKSTYYFRTINGVYQPDIIKKIANMGHEIGYHYEVLDKAKGDYDVAIKLFEKELEMMKGVVPIKTACMHGNPLKPWSNRDLWQYYDFNQYGIIGEPYLTIDYTKVMYFTDTGRSWNNSKYNVKDKTNHNQIRIKNTDQLIQIIKNETYPGICILTHPNRWSATEMQWITEVAKQNIKNTAKIGINLWNASGLLK